MQPCSLIYIYNRWLLLLHTGRVEYLQQRSNGPPSLIYLLPASLQKNLTDPGLVSSASCLPDLSPAVCITGGSRDSFRVTL